MSHQTHNLHIFSVEDAARVKMAAEIFGKTELLDQKGIKITIPNHLCTFLLPGRFWKKGYAAIFAKTPVLHQVYSR